MIQVENICRNFKIQKRRASAAGFVKDLFDRQYVIKEAVKDINFQIEQGEMVGYIGPNGAGKSTTIKMLSGILVPSSGRVLVNGIEPYKKRKENAFHIGVVFGQRTQLWWDIPVRDTLELYKKLYRIPEHTYKKNMEIFNDILELDKFSNVAVRQLSLGQRMRADLACAIIHDPLILYLDEPTIGLDVVVKEKIRDFIKEINSQKKTTVLLTTHDMSDIEKLCSRVMVIDNGMLMYDGDLDALKRQYGKQKIVKFILSGDVENLELPEIYDVQIRQKEKNKLVVELDPQKISPLDMIDFLRKKYEIVDFDVNDPEIEAIIRGMYQTLGRE